MILYTIIAQYRSGGQNLINWVKSALGNKFVVIHEPFNKDFEKYTSDTTLQDFGWLEDKKYFIKELWRPELNYNMILKMSSKIICLYRDNVHEQTISHMYSTKEKKYHHYYDQKDVDRIFNQDEYDKFRDEIEFNKKSLIDFAVQNDLPIISYENLYYGNGIERFKRIFDFETDIAFPYGSRYFIKIKKLI